MLSLRNAPFLKRLRQGGSAYMVHALSLLIALAVVVMFGLAFQSARELVNQLAVSNWL